ncbi:MAG: LCP family protein [Clostridiaceae bacterium]
MKIKKMSKKKKIITAIIAIIVAIIITGLVVVLASLNKVETKEIPKTDEELGIKKVDNTDIEDDVKPTLNIVLYGIDRRANDSGRSDSITILSIDYEHSKIKLSSIMRDTYVNVEGYGMTKINHAYAYGGPVLSIKTINQNFDLDIRDYALVDFEGLKEIVDEVGGIDINIKDYELPTMSKYGINSAGDYHLNGTQALAYCRIRYQGNGDYERTDRHRQVLEQLFDGVKNNNMVQMTSIINKILPYVETSLSKTDILSLTTSVVTSKITNLEQKRFPVDGFCHGDTIDGIYYLVIDKDENTKQMKEFIYDK